LERLPSVRAPTNVCCSIMLCYVSCLVQFSSWVLPRTVLIMDSASYSSHYMESTSYSSHHEFYHNHAGSVSDFRLEGQWNACGTAVILVSFAFSARATIRGARVLDGVTYHYYLDDVTRQHRCPSSESKPTPSMHNRRLRTNDITHVCARRVRCSFLHSRMPLVPHTCLQSIQQWVVEEFMVSDR
jgi:hypothetical protein